MLRTREDDRPLVAHYVHMKGQSKSRAMQLLEKYKATMQDSGLRQVFFETQGPSRVELVQYGSYPKPIFVLYVGLAGMKRHPVHERMRARIEAETERAAEAIGKGNCLIVVPATELHCRETRLQQILE